MVNGRVRQKGAVFLADFLEAMKAYGIEAARAMLGHRSILATQMYAEMDRSLVRKIVRGVG